MLSHGARKCLYLYHRPKYFELSGRKAATCALQLRFSSTWKSQETSAMRHTRSLSSYRRFDDVWIVAFFGRYTIYFVLRTFHSSVSSLIHADSCANKTLHAVSKMWLFLPAKHTCAIFTLYGFLCKKNVKRMLSIGGNPLAYQSNYIILCTCFQSVSFRNKNETVVDNKPRKRRQRVWPTVCHWLAL